MSITSLGKSTKCNTRAKSAGPFRRLRQLPVRGGWSKALKISPLRKGYKKVVAPVVWAQKTWGYSLKRGSRSPTLTCVILVVTDPTTARPFRYLRARIPPTQSQQIQIVAITPSATSKGCRKYSVTTTKTKCFRSRLILTRKIKWVTEIALSRKLKGGLSHNWSERSHLTRKT